MCIFIWCVVRLNHIGISETQPECSHFICHLNVLSLSLSDLDPASQFPLRDWERRVNNTPSPSSLSPPALPLSPLDSSKKLSPLSLSNLVNRISLCSAQQRRLFSDPPLSSRPKKSSLSFSLSLSLPPLINSFRKLYGMTKHFVFQA